MSYATSVQDAQLVELFEFVRGSETFRFTSASIDIVALGETWTRIPANRTEAKAGGDVSQDNLEIEFPKTSEFAKHYISPFVYGKTSVKKRVQTDTDEWAVDWIGKVAGGSLSGNLIKITCESVLVSAKRVLLNEVFQVGCRHALYGRGCNVDKELFKVEDVITGIGRNYVQVPAAASVADGTYNGGMIIFDGLMRFISNHVEDTLFITRQFKDIAINDDVEIYRGCDRRIQTCEITFNNRVNHGGWQLPRRNPFDGGSIL